MTFSTFEITELREDAENDYALEFTTGNSKLGILLTEDELVSVGQAMLDSADGDWDRFDGQNVEEIVDGE